MRSLKEVRMSDDIAIVINKHTSVGGGVAMISRTCHLVCYLNLIDYYTGSCAQQFTYTEISQMGKFSPVEIIFVCQNFV